MKIYTAMCYSVLGKFQVIGTYSTKKDAADIAKEFAKHNPTFKAFVLTSTLDGIVTKFQEL